MNLLGNRWPKQALHRQIFTAGMVIVCIHLCPFNAEASTVAATATKLPATDVKVLHEEWLSDATMLGSSDETAQPAFEKLKSHSRKDLIETAKAWLQPDQEPATQAAALRVVAAFQMVELKPLLFDLAKKDTSWRVFHTINTIATDADKPAVSQLYKARLDQPQSPSASMAIIDGLTHLKIPLSMLMFRKLTNSPSYEVRQTAVHNFMVNREDLPKTEQIERLKTSLVLKPYQVRLEAYEYFKDLSPKDQMMLKPALSEKACAKDPQDQVRVLCSEILANKLGGSKRTESEGVKK